ncbi:MAG: ATP-dependent DNA ligase [Actinomycetota bacterium]|nr:ATP-dependent DNA ligase [Actinomycetota bacterium]
MALPVKPPISPMLSKVADEIPRGKGWLYEPKWDGFRALIFKEGDHIEIASRDARDLVRYFPELPPLLLGCLPASCVIDGEIVVAGPSGLDFEALLLRIHPAASRVAKLSHEIPASFVIFDLLALGDRDLRDSPFVERRRQLEADFTVQKPSQETGSQVFLTPQTADPDEAAIWFKGFEDLGLDGIVAKRADLRYVPGERVMVKIKHLRTADCVVGGYRLSKGGDGVGSLLLGLYNDTGVLHYVGHTSSFTAKERRELLEELRPLEGGQSFGEGRTPGGPSRWSGGRETEWVALAPVLVCEVSFDHLQGARFRHAARLLRWRQDKPPEECTFEQLSLPPQR